MGMKKNYQNEWRKFSQNWKDNENRCLKLWVPFFSSVSFTFNNRDIRIKLLGIKFQICFGKCRVYWHGDALNVVFSFMDSWVRHLLFMEENKKSHLLDFSTVQWILICNNLSQIPFSVEWSCKENSFISHWNWNEERILDFELSRPFLIISWKSSTRQIKIIQYPLDSLFV